MQQLQVSVSHCAKDMFRDLYTVLIKKNPEIILDEETWTNNKFENGNGKCIKETTT